MREPNQVLNSVAKLLENVEAIFLEMRKMNIRSVPPGVCLRAELRTDWYRARQTGSRGLQEPNK